MAVICCFFLELRFSVSIKISNFFENLLIFRFFEHSNKLVRSTSFSLLCFFLPVYIVPKYSTARHATPVDDIFSHRKEFVCLAVRSLDNITLLFVFAHLYDDCDGAGDDEAGG